MTLAAGSRRGPYEILALAGAGPMAEVYRARDSRSGRVVALKLLPRHLAAHPQLRAWLEREARIAERLAHPAICRLLEVGRAEDADYVAMEYLEGESLAARLARGPLPPRPALEIARAMLGALEAAHALGIVHGDLKPANVMLLRDGGVKVLDFGLAHALAERGEGGTQGERSEAAPDSHRDDTPESVEARTGFVLGTPAYMSPEQSRGQSVDARTDLWALGVVLYEALSGVSPFRRATALETMRSITSDDPDWPSPTLVAGEPVRAIIRRALERDRDRRYASAREMRADVEAALAGV
jgi:serine/threonine protein kinase